MGRSKKKGKSRSSLGKGKQQKEDGVKSSKGKEVRVDEENTPSSSSEPSSEPCLNPTDFLDRLKNQYDFQDLDLAKQQTSVLIGYIDGLIKDRELSKEVGKPNKTLIFNETVKSNETVQLAEEQAQTLNDMPTKKSWKDVAKSSLTSQSAPLNYITPVMEEGVQMAKLQSNETHLLVRQWDHVVAIFIAGPRINLYHFQRYVKIQWPLIKPPRIIVKEEGYFVLKLQNQEDFDEVCNGESYARNRIPVLVRKWEPDFDFCREFLSAISIWVKLNKLPLHCWRLDSLSQIGSIIGIPLFVDECTTKQKRTSYARIKIQVDLTKSIPKEVKVENLDGTRFNQLIEYEWLPPFCQKCKQFGHVCQKEPVIEQQWFAKTQNAPAEAGTMNVTNTLVTSVNINSNVTPVEESHEITSEHEGGWVTATKRKTSGQINLGSSKGAFNVLETVEKDGEGSVLTKGGDLPT